MKKRFIFDCDGTICDTNIEFHAETEAHLLNDYCGVIVSPEEIERRFAGLATKTVFSELAPGCDVEFLRKKKWELVHELTKTKQMKCLPGMYELVCELWKRRIPISIATASPVPWLKKCLKVSTPAKFYRSVPSAPFLSLERIFKGLAISADVCKNQKPAPDVFYLAEIYMNRIYPVNGEEWETFVVGDGRSDVLGGLAAGMKVLYLSSNTEFDENPLVKRFDYSWSLASHIYKMVKTTP